MSLLFFKVIKRSNQKGTVIFWSFIT